MLAGVAAPAAGRRSWLTSAAVPAETPIPSSLSSRSRSLANAASAAGASPAPISASIRSAPADSSSGHSAARRRAQPAAAAESPAAAACCIRSRQRGGDIPVELLARLDDPVIVEFLQQFPAAQVERRRGLAVAMSRRTSRRSTRGRRPPA